jgi:hypothetical protein
LLDGKLEFKGYEMELYSVEQTRRNNLGMNALYCRSGTCKARGKTWMKEPPWGKTSVGVVSNQN